MTGEVPEEVILLNQTLTIFDIGQNPIFADEFKFNRILGQLRNLNDLRYDATNVESSNGIPTEIGLLKDLEVYDCTNCQYSGPLTGDAFPNDLKICKRATTVQWKNIEPSFSDQIFLTFVFSLSTH